MNTLDGRRFPFVLGIMVAITYGNSLNGSFHYDDFHSLVTNPHIRSLTNIPEFFVDPRLFSSDEDKAMYRPVLLLSYAVNYGLGEYGVRGYHIFNGIIHFACSLLVWSIARHSGCTSRGAQWAACFFALHPLASEPVNYVSSRSELLGAFFYLASFRLLAASAWHTSLTGVVCFALGLLSKEMVITLPLMVWVHGALREHPVPSARSTAIWLWSLTAVYMAWQVWNRFLPTSVSHAPRGLHEQMWTQLKALTLYIKLLLVPVGLNVEHQFSEAVSLLDGTVVVSALLLCTLAILIWLHVRGDFRFWLCWALISLLPATIVPLNVLINEHRLYLPMAGLAVLVGKLWPHGIGNKRIVTLLPVVLVFLVAHTFIRNAVWENELTLWQDSASKSPLMPRPHVHLGNAQAASGDRAGAKSSFQRALELEPVHRAARTNLANLHLEHALELGQQHLNRTSFLNRALDEFDTVLSSDSDYREALSGRATVLSLLGRKETAVAAHERLLRIHPHFAEGYYNMGLLLYDSADFPAAAKAFERSASLQPGADVFNELGNAYAGAKQFLKAAESYRLAHELSPNDFLFPRNLGEALIGVGAARLARGDTAGCIRAWQESQAAFERVLRLTPDDTKATARLQFLSKRLR